MHSYYSIVKVKFVNLKVISVHIGLVFLCIKFDPSEFTFLLNKSFSVCWSIDCEFPSFLVPVKILYYHFQS